MQRAKISLHTGFYIAMAFMLLLLPLRWIIAWMFSMIIHELGHYIALRLMGIEIYCIHFRLLGARMDTQQMSCAQEFFSAVAGPIAGLLLMFLAKWMPLIAICGFIQSAFNLLPVYPLDGGRAMRCALQRLFPKTWQMIYRLWEWLVLLTLTLLALYGALKMELGVMPVLFIIYLWIQIKRPCIQRKQKVQ